MLSEGQLACVDRIGLTVLVACRGGIGDSPVIEHLRDMVNPVGFLDAAKQEIIVLGPVTLLPKKADFFCKTLSHHNQMADIVNAPEEIRIEIRLHPGSKEPLSLLIAEILVSINEIQIPVFVQCLYHLIESIGFQKIVVVGEHQKFSGSHPDCLVGVLGNSGIDFKMLQLNPRIIAIKLLHKGRGAFFRAAIRQTEFEIPVALRRDRLEKLP